MNNILAPTWLGNSINRSGGPTELNLDRELKPYIAFIVPSNSTSNPDYGPDIKYLTWDLVENDEGYKKVIPFSGDTGHKKGFVFRNLSNSEEGSLSSGYGFLTFPDSVGLGNNELPNIIIPRVKTYSQVTAGVYEESYDSARININTGEVEVFSLTNGPYLVIIY